MYCYIRSRSKSSKKSANLNAADCSKLMQNIIGIIWITRKPQELTCIQLCKVWMIHTENVYMLAVVYSEDMSSWMRFRPSRKLRRLFSSLISCLKLTLTLIKHHSVSRVLVGQSPFLCMFWGLIPFLYLYFYQQHMTY